MFKKIVHRFVMRLLRLLRLYNSSLFRKIFWNLRAKVIDDRWGKSEKGDYGVLRDIIASLNTNRILDIGCGSGRLFPLYKSLNIKKIIGQDIAQSALNIASVRYNYQNIQLSNLPITELDYPEFYFDLIVSNRVLQHIPPNSVEPTVKTICRLGKFVYINEVSDVDIVFYNLLEIEDLKNPYCFKHDYERLFGIFYFKVKDEGLIGKQKWVLFTKRE